MDVGHNRTDDNEEKSGSDYNYIGGKMIATVPPGEEIVITGIAGSFPESDNIHEFRDNLFNKKNLVTPNKRWNIQHSDIPPCTGTIPTINQYDPGFFGVHERQSKSMDTMGSMLMEKTIEAIFDAGLHPSDLENTRTGVFVGACYSENEKTAFFSDMTPHNYAFTGAARSMLTHRLSYFLKLKGPSYVTDTACSSSLYALEHAYRALRLGEIDYAIVGGTNLCTHPFVSLQFARLGVLTMGHTCRPFDQDGDGYVRSEVIAVLLLQKSKNAKRVYAELIHTKTNCDGYKEQSITFPSRDMQVQLLMEVYNECGVDRNSLSFLEAHGTGTLVGDPEEGSAIGRVFAESRAKQLLIGSVKSNIGHSEPASGVVSIIKCIIGMETGLIPPNINFENPRKEIRGITERRLKVVTEKTPFEDERGLVGVNSFGFGGGNAHLVMRWNPKTKANRNIVNDNLPRLVCVSGRTEEAIISLLNSVTNIKFDPEYIKLLHEGFRKNVATHVYRGYSIVSQMGEIARSTKLLKCFPDDYLPLYLSFGELYNWYSIGCDLIALPAFATFIQRIQKILLRQGINIQDALSNKSPSKGISDILGSVIIQLGLIELFNLVEVTPSCIFECQFGELLSAYCDKSLSLEETINCVFSVHKVITNTNIVSEPNNNNNQEIKAINNNYINGNAINGNQSSNGDDFQNGTETTLSYLKMVMKNKGSSSLRNSLLQSVLKEVKSNKATEKIQNIINAIFSSALQNNLAIKPHSVVLKIGENSLGKLEDVSIISLFGKENNHLLEFLNGIGSLYEFGYNPQVSKIYPPVALPVSRGTEMISPHIRWNHRKPKYVRLFDNMESTHVDFESWSAAGRAVNIQTDSQEWKYLKGHVVDGRNLFPAAGYLYLVWGTYSILNDLSLDVTQVCFENCRFIRATSLPKKGEIVMQITMQAGSGNFEVMEGDALIVKGRIYSLGATKTESKDLYNFPYESTATGVKLKTRDIYKELRLRGYNYSGEFRAIEECDIKASNSLIKWEDNWVTFIDNMFQTMILQNDTRQLYVPTFISKITILAKAHLEYINSEEVKGKGVPVSTDAFTGTIRSGGINISGLSVNSIPRKKVRGIPVLESYRFVPNFTELDINQSVRVNTQIILENALLYQVKAVELIDEVTNENTIPLSPLIKSALEDQPLIHPQLKIFSKTPLENVDIEVEDKMLQNETECLLVIASNLLERPHVLGQASAALADNGFIISRESHQHEIPKDVGNKFSIFTVHRTSNETLVMLRKQSNVNRTKYINVNCTQDFSWLSEVQDAIVRENNEDVVLYAENEPKNGIVGLVNCLRREPQSKNVRCLFMVDKAEKFNPQQSFYTNQLEKHMAVNVYKNKQWGTYRHLLLENVNNVQSEHCFVNLTTKGDLSSLRWMEGPLRHNMKQEVEKKLVYIYYAALNFKDLMAALERISADTFTKDRLAQECLQGIEFSGRDANGNRVMGMVCTGALSTLVLDDSYLSFAIPDEWSMEEAATVPVVYSTVIYSLIMRGQMKRGESILIHSGTGGVGQAAIRIALHHGCKVFTTVGTEEKRDFLKRTFPQLNDHHIGNSHEESFEQIVLAGTKGRGVDLVLNSLAEEKLVASIRCLARGGRFIEIGKFDIGNNVHLSTLLFRKEASFHGSMLDQLMNDPPHVKRQLTQLVNDGIKNGSIRPLQSTVFKYDEVEQAFRYMATGKHMGKVLVQVRQPEKELLVAPKIATFPGMARYFCDPDKVYIVTGGLGGFGLELTDWLILRGARKLVLTSRKGITTGYQNYRISIWKTYGVTVHISTASVTTRNGCIQLINESLKLGRVDAIFNLAVVLADGLFENQTPESFVTSFGPKAYATEYLDELTRKLCPDLSEFVVFSSVSCGRGNAGQTNYGMSNSVMERICEDRKTAGFPALAIEWGAVGDVGLVAEMLEEDTEIEIGGTLQQRISSCLQVMDTLIKQREAPIVSSIVVAEKRITAAADNIIDAVVNILGLNDSKSVSLHSTLSELGMDSMTAVEIKQVLERDFEVFLSAKDIRTLTLAKLKDIQDNKTTEVENKEKGVVQVDISLLFRWVADEGQNSFPYVEMPSGVPKNAEAPTVLLFPGIAGFATDYDGFTECLKAHTICVQISLEDKQQTIHEMANSVMPSVEKHLPNKKFCIICYSYGSLIALEVVSILESRGYSGTVICLDGSPLFIRTMANNMFIESETITGTTLMCYLLSFYISMKEIEKYKEDIHRCANWDEKVNLGIEIVKHHTAQNANHQRLMANNIYWRIKTTMQYTPSYSKLKSDLKLLKAEQPSVLGLPEDYGLSEYCEKPIESHTYSGNHSTILQNEAIAEKINSYILAE